MLHVAAADAGALELVLPRCDIFVRAADAPQPRLFVADMDSTMIGVECIDELADYAGLKAEVGAVTEAAMRGELDFEAALRRRVSLLEGLETTTIASCLAERVHETPGARTLVATLKAHGVRTVMVSGGFTAFAVPVGTAIGFDRIAANELETGDERLTGRLAGEIVDAARKAALLTAEAEGRGGVAAALAIGDGANDIPMVRMAGYGIAFHAKPILARAADARIRNGDLTAVLHALGIRRADWR